MTSCVLETLPKALEMSSWHLEALSGPLEGLPVVIEGLAKVLEGFQGIGVSSKRIDKGKTML